MSEYMHIGVRLPPELADKLLAVLEAANSSQDANGLPRVTKYALVQHWIRERIEAEFKKLGD